MKLEKITREVKPIQRRTYEDACATAHGLDLVGERWALLVIRELMFGAKRFSDLREGLPAISANVLTQRLEGLELAGIVLKKKLPPPAAVQVYELTEWGYEAEPVFQALGRWASRSPFHNAGLPFSAASLMLSLRTMIDAGQAGDIRAKIGFRLGDETFTVQIADGRLDVKRAELDEANVIFTGSPEAIAGVIYGGQPLAVLEDAGILKVEGDHNLGARFVTLFPLPEKVRPRN
ncbi:MAG: winged helix-turn-helix transcriptional regulator [Phyllobacterium sp.]